MAVAAFKDKPAPRWTLAWLRSSVFQRQGQFDAAERQLRSILEIRDEEMRRRNLDFSRDYVVINELGNVLFERSKGAAAGGQEALRRKAVETFQRTLAVDSENLAAHYNLYLLYSLLGESEKAAEHQKLHAKYKPDENARDRVIALHRQNNRPSISGKRMA